MKSVSCSLKTELPVLFQDSLGWSLKCFPNKQKHFGTLFYCTGGTFRTFHYFSFGSSRFFGLDVSRKLAKMKGFPRIVGKQYYPEPKMSLSQVPLVGALSLFLMVNFICQLG